MLLPPSACYHVFHNTVSKFIIAIAHSFKFHSLLLFFILPCMSLSLGRKQEDFVSDQCNQCRLLLYHMHISTSFIQTCFINAWCACIGGLLYSCPVCVCSSTSSCFVLDKHSVQVNSVCTHSKLHLIPIHT